MEQRANLGRGYGTRRAIARPVPRPAAALPRPDGAIEAAWRVVLGAVAAERRHPATAPVLVAALVGLWAGALWLHGQPLTCPCGHIALWASDMTSNQNSQQIADVYSIEHAGVGLFLFVLLRPLPARVACSSKLIAVAIGAIGWEILENSAWMIQRYREVTISQHYAGDSVVNSSTDVLFCCLAFAVAARLPWRVPLALAVLCEVIMTVTIHDSILLSLLALVTGNDALRQWQLAR